MEINQLIVTARDEPIWLTFIFLVFWQELLHMEQEEEEEEDAWRDNLPIFINILNQDIPPRKVSWPVSIWNILIF